MYTDNSLVTTIKVHKNLNIALFPADISIGFSLQNTSTVGDLYTGGSVTQIEVSNPNSAISNVSSGQNADFNFSATINRRNLKSNAYYKYAITYDVNGVKKYFFYTINILSE